MTRYEFRLVLLGSLKFTEDITDALSETGRDDGMPWTCDREFSKGNFYGEKENVSLILPRCQIHFCPPALHGRDLSHGWLSWRGVRRTGYFA